MPVRLAQTVAVSRRASHRGAVDALIGRAGRWLTVGAAVGVAGVGAWKVIPGLREVLPWWALLGAPLVVAGAVALVVSVVRRWPTLRAARELDERLGLRDRLSSALELTGSADRDPFVALAVRDAERLSADADVRRAVPFHWNRAWAFWPAIAGAGIAAGLFTPEWDFNPSAPDRPAMRAAAETAAKQIDAVSQGLRQTAGESVSDPGTARDLDDLSQIEQELADGRISPEEARARAARRLEEIASQTERVSQGIQGAADRARRALAESAQPAPGSEGAPSPESSTGLRRALREGDLGSAAAAAREIARDADTMPAEQREAIARDLTEIARQLDAKSEGISEATPPSPSADTARPEEPSAEAGGRPEAPPTDDPQGDKSKQAAPGAAPQPTPEEPGANPQSKPDPPDEQSEGPPPDPEVARKAAESSEPQAPRDRPPSEPTNPLERLSQALRQAARDMQRPAEPRRGESAPEPSDRPPGPETAKPQDQTTKPRGDQDSVQPRQQQDSKGQNPATPQPGAQQRPSDKAAGKNDQSGAESDAARRPTPSEEGSKSDQTSPQPKPTGQPEPGTKPDAPTTPTPPTPGQDGGKVDPSQGKPGAEQQPKPGNQPAAGGKSGETPDSTRQGRPGKEPSDQRPRQDPGRQPTPDGDTKQAPSGDSTRPQGPGPTPGAEPTPVPGQPGGTNQPGGADPRPDQRGTPALERLAREFEQLQRSGAGARENQESARRLREQARKLLENASPEDLRKLNELARQNNHGDEPGTGPGVHVPRDGAPAWNGRDELIDARGETQAGADGQGRVISQWPASAGRSPSGESGQVSGQAVRQAAAGAQRAVEQQAVPPQYGPFVKRVFKRFTDRAGPEKPGAPSPTPDAPDAQRKQ